MATQPPVVAWTQGPVASASAAPGEMVGIVVDAANGKPLAETRVFRVQSAVGDTTDSNGRFRISMPNVAEPMRVMRIGYTSYSTVIGPRSDSGMVMVIVLAPTVTVPCRVTSGGAVSIDRNNVVHPIVQQYASVIVVARDAITGRAPIGLVSVAVRDGEFRDSLAMRADTGDRVVATAAPDRAGNYDVTIRSAAYREWTGSSATRPVPGCDGEFSPAVLHAWLIRR